MGLAVNEEDILAHIQPRIDATAGSATLGDVTAIVDRSATPAIFDDRGASATTTTFHPGMQFNFAAATPVTGTPASS